MDAAMDAAVEAVPSAETGGTLFDGIENAGGGGVLGNIVSVIPQADPAVEKLNAAETVGTDSADAPADDGRKVINVDPKVYTYVQDHKGHAFDPEKHQVDAEGNPVFNARGKVKRLEPGKENPVKLVFSNIKNMLLPEPERPQDECAAQAAVQSVEVERQQSAEIVADAYSGAGYVMRGGSFLKGWEKARRKKLVDSLVRYQRIKGIVIPIKAEWILVHAFGTDLMTVEGAAMFEKKGGLLGFMGRKGWNERAKKLAEKAEEFAHAEAEKEQGAES